MADSLIFQGRSIARTELTVRGVNALPCTDANGDHRVLEIDDVVSLHIEGRVVGGGVVVGPDGEMVYRATVKPLDTNFQPWDASDPDDDGVARWNKLGGTTP